LACRRNKDISLWPLLPVRPEHFQVFYFAGEVGARFIFGVAEKIPFAVIDGVDGVHVRGTVPEDENKLAVKGTALHKLAILRGFQLPHLLPQPAQVLDGVGHYAGRIQRFLFTGRESKHKKQAAGEHGFHRRSRVNPTT
jgi:hypothetical protein